MKTATEVRNLMAKPSAVINLLEKEIVAAAKEGKSTKRIYINHDMCDWDMARAAVDLLRESGYTAKAQYIADQRDGNVILFIVKW